MLDKTHWAAYSLKKMLECVAKLGTIMMGFSVNLNSFMRAYNGNGRRRLLFSHLNFRGGNLTVNQGKREQWFNTIGSTKPDVIGLSETILGSNENKVCDLPGYSWETKSDNPRISVMVNTSLDYRRRRDLEVDNFAAIWLELCPKSKTPILVCQVYREWQLCELQNGRMTSIPGSGQEVRQQERWAKFIDKLSQVASTNQELHCCGDLNLDRQKWRQVAEDDDGEDDLTQPHARLRLPLSQQLMVDSLHEKVLNAHGVVQLQKKISFVKVDKNGKVTKSCLDLFLTNRPMRISELRLCQTNESDHMMVMGFRRTNNKMPQPSVMKKRKWSKINWEQFNKDFIESGAENLVTSCEELNACAEFLTAACRVHLDTQEKVKTLQLRKKYTPWVDESVRMMIERKKLLFEIWKRTESKDDWVMYRKQSNYIVKVIKQKKTAYLKQSLRSTLQSSDMWKNASKEMKIVGSGPPTSLVVNGELTSDPSAMAEQQNDFFISKPLNIASSIPHTETDPLLYTKKFLKDKEVPGFDFSRTVVTEYEVSKVIDNLKNTTSTGHDEINVIALKNMKDSVLTSLTYIVNLSLRTSSFPDIWKLAKCVPLHKNNGDKTDPSKYRPIALLPVFSKILEKFVSKWLNQYMEQNNLWSDRQHGYRKHRSTATALLQLQEEIMKKYEEGNDIAVLSFDSSAAFDTLTHSVLLDKLKLYGCSDHVINWFKSYLENRWQFTEIMGKKSSTQRILQGVFQGSVLGPLLYILYCNCMSVLQDDFTKLSLYADDANAAIKLTKNKYENRVRIRVKAAEMQRYMDSNRLKFNSEKTHLIVKTRGVNNNHNYLNLEMGDKVIEQSETVKVLGVVIGRDEKYKEYLVDGKNSMTRFLNTRHNLLKMLSKYADLKSRKALAEGLVLSKLQYCLTIWACTNQTILHQFHVFLNSVVRTVFGVGKKRFVNMAPMYKKLKWHTMAEMIRYHDLITVHSVIKNGTPWDIAEKFHKDKYHGHFTRASQKAYQRNSETTSVNTVRAKGFVCRAAKEYQEIPKEITTSKLFPRWAFKDYCRSEIGGWDMKPETEGVLEYIRELKAAENMYY